ncbi:MAG: methylated-DNA--[protein]-cysteine S-methyltransferase [Dehalococcoidia bacterium]
MSRTALTCQEVRRQFTASDTPVVNEDIQTHLSVCRHCRNFFAQMATAVHAVSLLSPELNAPALVRRIRNALRAAQVTSTRASPATPVSYEAWESPLGKVLVAFWKGGVVRLALDVSEEAFVEAVLRQCGATPRAGRLPLRLRRVVEVGLAGWAGHGSNRPPSLNVAWLGVPPFQQRVLEVVTGIPWGQVRTYAWVAKEVGRPRAVRAVAQALAHNPVPLFIPCHRVVARDGSLQGYSMGVERKASLLKAEGVRVEDLPSLVGQFYGCTSTRIVCWPTCSHARRVSPRRLRLFPSVEEAQRAGFRPCTVCRP